MLRKLCKYDFCYAGRIFLLLYGIMAFLTVLGKTIFTLVPEGLENTPLLSVLVPTYILLILCLVIGFEIFLIIRFYRSFFTDEGYLYHTLPVKTWQLILSKLLVNVLLSLLGLAIVVLCGLVLLAGTPMDYIRAHWAEIRQMIQFVLGLSPCQALFYLLLALPLSQFSSYAMFFASIALGQVLIPQHRVLGACAAYILYYVILQVLCSVPMIAFTLRSVGSLSQNLSETELSYWVQDFYRFTYLFVLGLCLVEAFVFFFITNYIMKKKLNLN